MRSANFFAASRNIEASQKLSTKRVNGDEFRLDDGGNESVADVGIAPREYMCDHRGLKGEARCLGCGRTRNEILLDGE